MFQVYFECIKNLVMKYTSKYTLNLFLKCICISFLTQKYTRSKRSKFMCLMSNSEVYFK